MTRNKRTSALILASSYFKNHYLGANKKRYLYLNSGINLSIEKISKFYLKYQIPTFVAVDNKEDLDFEAFKSCKFIYIRKSESIIESLHSAIKELNIFSKLIINPVQVIPSKPFKDYSISLSSHPYKKENWSAVKIDKNKISFLFRDDLSNEGEISNAFTGRIFCQKKDVLEILPNFEKYQKNDLAYLAYYLWTKFKYKFHFEDWFDLTHDTLRTKTKLGDISSREFHSLSYLEESNLIIKTHKDGGSFKNILKFYDNIPPNLRRYFPSLIEDKNLNYNNQYALEYVPFPTLAEIFIHGDYGFLTWEKIIYQLKNIYDSLYCQENIITDFDSSLFYSKKLKARKEKLLKKLDNKEHSILKFIYQNSYMLNGNKMPPIEDTFEKLRVFLENHETNSSASFGHGDLCFNNILLEPNSISIKLIDPKAIIYKNEVGIVPYKYDLAKLNHSFRCLYDSIICNMYSLNLNKDNFSLKIFTPRRYSFIIETFTKVFFNSSKELSEINILTANLFLSMLPLHCEDPKRVLALALIGNLIYEKSKNFSSDFFS